MNKTPDEVYDLYEMLGGNAQQNNVRGRRGGVVNEVAGNQSTDALIRELMKQVQTLTTRDSGVRVIMCESCGMMGHGANVWPSVYGDDPEQVNWAKSGAA